MKIYDISMTIHPEMPVYNNRSENLPQFKNVSDFKTGKAYESAISFMNMHTGTHLDAPRHMLENGDLIDRIQLEQVITPCRVLDLTNITAEITDTALLTKNIKPNEFILLKTKNSFNDQFDPNFVYLQRDGAEYLKKQRISGVGIDNLGIERDQPNHDTHKILFKASILILEGLRLRNIPEGSYLLIAAPLKIHGVEASPVRAVLLNEL